jgi:ureidoglycolate hydrolase
VNRRLRAEPLTARAFTPFGQVIERPRRGGDAGGPGWRWWAETLLLPTDGRPFGVGYLDLAPAPLRFDWAERHFKTVEVLVPLGAGCLVYVGPPEPRTPAGQLPPLGDFRVFWIPPGKGVAMNPGVWHGAPLALGGPAQVLCLILEHTGRDDVTLARFADRPVEIEG